MVKMPPATLASLVERARSGLRSTERKMLPPELAVLDFVTDLWGFQIVYTLLELGVPEALASGARSTEELATELELDEDHLYRLLRAATNLDVLHEDPGRAFSLRPLGTALCDPEGLRHYISLMGSIGWRFWARLGDSVRAGTSAIEMETGQEPFSYFIGDENARHLFNRAMTAISTVSADAFVATFDASRFRRVVDVGGGHGYLLSAILKSAPDATGVLFDLPEVVEGSVAVLEREGVRERTEIVGGDFFAEVPAEGDLYVLKSILHDWRDDEASRILGRVREAARPQATVALFETVVPGPNEKHFAKLLDIEMIVHAGGRERTEPELASLFERSGFRLTRVIPSPGPLSVVEARAV